MKPLLILVVAGIIAALMARPGSASLQPQMYCWSGDSEFPVACEDEGEDEVRGSGGLRSPAPARSKGPRLD